MERENQFGYPAVKALIFCFIWFVASLAAAQDKPPINRVKEMLQTGKVTIGPIVQIPSGPVASLLSRSGFDWLWIDMEHGGISIETAQLMIDATKGSSTVPLVRIPLYRHSPRGMDDWFSTLAAGTHLPPDAARALDERGFVVLPGSVPAQQFERLARAYDAAVTSAAAEDVRTGRTTTRVTDFVNRGAEFDGLYVFPPLLAAVCRIIGRPFKLSALHARTLRPGADGQELHVDVTRQTTDWPLVGFILMVDAFRADNGATRFVPGSHRWPTTPEEALADPQAAHADEILACGPAGSLLIFNGSTWHGHTANRSAGPRRSFQGAFIPRDGLAATDFGARMRPETRARLGPVAWHVLAL